MGQSHARPTRVLSVTYWTESFSSERPPAKSANGTVWPSDDGGEISRTALTLSHVRLPRWQRSAARVKMGLCCEPEADLRARRGVRGRSSGCVRPSEAREREGARTRRKRTWCSSQRAPWRQ